MASAEGSATTSASAPAAGSATKSEDELKRAVIGRWKGPYEAELADGGRYILHAGGSDIPGTWKYTGVSGKTVSIEIVMPGLNSRDRVDLEVVSPDELQWTHHRKRGQTKPETFRRVKDAAAPNAAEEDAAQKDATQKDATHDAAEGDRP